MAWFRNSTPSTATVNGHAIHVDAGETLLSAALRQGVTMPYSCRVGGCGTCRCRLRSGRVVERTESGYLLSQEEIDAGTILACQSEPRGDVAIEFDAGQAAVVRSIAGRVVSQRRITHDMTELGVRLDQGLPYRAGQHARLSLAGFPGSRCYSFATPMQADAQLRFLIRRVPGGRFSTHVDGQDLIGAAIQVEGPLGDFYLRAGASPLLMVAGGSGLPPLLAMLQDALAGGRDQRPVTLLFGARTQQDLYALDALADLARKWRGGLNFVPVLSAPDPAWQGARGWVVDHLGDHGADVDAYLCGPPAMIDATAETLRRMGISESRIHTDRFVDAAPSSSLVPESSNRPIKAIDSVQAAAWFDYLKFFLFHGIGLFSAAALLVGGWGTTIGLLAVVSTYLIGDALLGVDERTPRYRFPQILTAQLWMALPLLLLIVFVAVWRVGPGDAFGFGAWFEQCIGIELLAGKGSDGGHVISAWILTGLMIGMIGTIPAHELTHRTWDRVSMGIGRWLLAFSFDASFAIEHVYGHHRYVSTRHDPATAPRGRNVYGHIVLSTLRGNLSAWRIESARLKRRGFAVLGPRNALLRGYLMSVVLVAAAAVLGGITGAIFFIASALWGKALLEIVNYMEHYGIVRDPATPVQPRHSWNSNRRLSSWTLFNLTRHSHHHAQGEVAYQDLKPFPEAPTMIAGYLTTIVIALIPPLWFRLMDPKLLAWDRDYASEQERRLLAQQAHAAK